jgi:hypothetical protein
MLILSPDDCERIILALLVNQPLSDEDRRALILELVAARRRALDHFAPSSSHDHTASVPPLRRWAFVKEATPWVNEVGGLLGPGIARGTILARKR